MSGTFRRNVSLLVLGLHAALPRIALGQPTGASVAPGLEARQLHERGLHLFDEGDDAGAMAEFKRAYDLGGSLLDLYDLGLVYAKLGRAVEAIDALDRVLGTPGALPADMLPIARRRRDEQAARIAYVDVAANAEGAAVEIDGIEASKTPLASPLRVTGGSHVIGIVAPGFEPSRKEITIAAGEKQSLRFDLVAIQGRLAHLAVKTHLPGADVFADGARVATTPLMASITLAPGKHRIELRRSGYTTASADLSLDDGAIGEVGLEPEEDRAALVQNGGDLALDVSETVPVITVDGRLRGVYTVPLRLVGGPHHLLVERGDFEPTEREVIVLPGSIVTIRVALQPTPDYREHYVSRAQSMRTWGIVSLVSGVLLAGGGVGLLVYDAQQRSDGNAAFNVSYSIPLCQMRPLPAMGPGTAYDMMCAQPQVAAAAKVNDANTRDSGAWTAVGVGAAATALGVTLLIAGGDPHKYDSSPTPAPAPAERRTLASVRPMFWALRRGGGIGMTVSF